MEFAYMNFLVL